MFNRAPRPQKSTEAWHTHDLSQTSTGRALLRSQKELPPKKGGVQWRQLVYIGLGILPLLGVYGASKDGGVASHSTNEPSPSMSWGHLRDQSVPQQEEIPKIAPATDSIQDILAHFPTQLLDYQNLGVMEAAQDAKKKLDYAQLAFGSGEYVLARKARDEGIAYLRTAIELAAEAEAQKKTM